MPRWYVLAVAQCAMFGCLLSSSEASAATHVLTYNVESPTYGTIGTYTNRISQDGDTTDVRSDLHVAVKVIGISLFHQDGTREERWQHGRLVAFQSSTDDNGTPFSVTGQAQAGRFVIHTTDNGTVTAPAQVHPSNPWSPSLLQNGTMMSTRTGLLTSVVVKNTGYVNATFDGRTMRVDQWFIDGVKHQVVWIDGRGVIVAFQTEENGHTINFVLKNEAGADQEQSASRSDEAAPADRAP